MDAVCQPELIRFFPRIRFLFVFFYVNFSQDHWLDQLSRVTFPLTFATFNVVYWSYCLLVSDYDLPEAGVGLTGLDLTRFNHGNIDFRA